MEKLEYNPNRKVVSGCLHSNGDLDIVFNTGEQIHMSREEIINSYMSQEVGSCEQTESGTVVRFNDGTEVFVPKTESHSNKST